MLSRTAVKRATGLVLPLAIGGSVLAIRTAAASNALTSATTSCGTTTSGSGTTTTGSTTTGSTTTTSGGLPTTLPITLPITLPVTLLGQASGADANAAATTTTAAATTTTSGGLPITIPIGGGATTTTAPTATTACSTTTSTQRRVVITELATDHVAGHAVVIGGTAPDNSSVLVTGRDPKNGTHNLGLTTASADGVWRVRLAHGFLYNTVVQASSGGQQSNTVPVNVHQVLNIKTDKLVGHRSNGFHYTVTGSSASQISGEAITVSVNGKVVGRGKMRADGTFTVKFVEKKKHQKATLKGTGKTGSGAEYTLPGSRTFRP